MMYQCGRCGLTRASGQEIGIIQKCKCPWEFVSPASPQRTLVGLTDKEIKLQWSEFWETECHPWAIEFARAIEAKLKEKNG